MGRTAACHRCLAPEEAADGEVSGQRRPGLGLETLQQGEDESRWRSNPATPQHRLSTCSVIATGDINEFQMYQRFRLKMVQTFGSLSSALFEFGADPETGALPRERFEDVCAGQLGMLSQAEASLLFSHVTNADPLDGGLGGLAFPRHFNVSDEEWQQLVQIRTRERSGNEGPAMPFASGPSGASMGSYHRAIRLHEQPPTPRDLPMTPAGRSSSSSAANAGGGGSPAASAAAAGAGAGTGAGSAGASGTEGSRRRAGSALPWRQPQKPWMRSVLAGEGLPQQAEGFWSARGQARGQPFSTAGKASLLIAQPKHQQLGGTERVRNEDHGHLVGTCPSRRREMEPILCARQAEGWWPYGSPRRPAKLRLATPRRG